MDYEGSDLDARFGIFSVEACASECWAEPACKSYTFAKAQGACYLKSTAQPDRLSSTCCDSGLRPCSAPPTLGPRQAHTYSCGDVERNMDYEGSDLDARFGIFSVEACASECWAEPACESYTFAKAQGACYLKSATQPDRVPSTCCDSGLRPCSAPPTPAPRQAHNDSCGDVERDMDYEGNDLDARFSIFSVQACASECWAEPACKSYTFAKSQGACYLKSAARP